MQKFIVMIATVIMLGACSSTDIQNITGSPGATLDPHQGVYVTVPSAPTEGDNPTVGQYIATAVASHFSKSGVTAWIADSPSSFTGNLTAARQRGAGYMVVPVLTNWAHNATQWSSNPSTFGLRIGIVNVVTGQQIRVDSITSESSHISFLGTDPKELLNDALDDYLELLYPEK
ncbi:MAG TPA: DUF4823 domain-containing protein [Gammaproteobacteria bacterium]|nr:DUF4823 domain-containing protein [Gammaproteobacteria bacterium]